MWSTTQRVPFIFCSLRSSSVNPATSFHCSWPRSCSGSKAPVNPRIPGIKGIEDSTTAHIYNTKYFEATFAITK